MRKRTIKCICPPSLLVSAVLPARAAAEQEGAGFGQAVLRGIDALGLPYGTAALYGVGAIFVIVGLCMVKKNRSLSLLLLVMAGLLVYVGYSFVK